jgi:hypothetical protein
MLKSMTENPVLQLPAIDDDGEEIEGKFYNGVYSTASEEEAGQILMEIHGEILEKGYIAFISEANFVEEGEEPLPDKIAIIKSEDQLDIIRYKKTCSSDGTVTPEKIIEKLKQWDEQYAIVISGAGQDWVEIDFMELPDNFGPLVKDIYEFCPSCVEDGVGSIEELEEVLKEYGILHLWWE